MNWFEVAKSGLKNVSRCLRVSQNLMDKGFHREQIFRVARRHERVYSRGQWLGDG